MYALFITMSIRNCHFATAGGIAMRFLIEPVYCMTWIWTPPIANNKSKSPIEQDNIWARACTRQDLHSVILSELYHMIERVIRRNI